jgi:hypothetical protein
MNKMSMSHPATSDHDGKIVDQAKQAVSHVASQAREQVNSELDAQKGKAVEMMGSVATAIRETSEKLKGVGPLGDVAGRAAQGIEKAADFFEGKKIGDVVRDVESFARREPALFIGAALAIGVVGGRFLKSSGHRDEGASGSGSNADDYRSHGEFNDAAPRTGFAAGGPQTPRTSQAPQRPLPFHDSPTSQGETAAAPTSNGFGGVGFGGKPSGSA